MDGAVILAALGSFAGAVGAQTPAITQIAGGGSQTCALDATGQVWCSGSSAFGQLGDGTTSNRLTPVPVEGFTGAVEIARGRFHSCALLAKGGSCAGGQTARGNAAIAQQPITRVQYSLRGSTTRLRLRLACPIPARRCGQEASCVGTIVHTVSLAMGRQQSDQPRGGSKGCAMPPK